MRRCLARAGSPCALRPTSVTMEPQLFSPQNGLRTTCGPSKPGKGHGSVVTGKDRAQGKSQPVSPQDHGLELSLSSLSTESESLRNLVVVQLLSHVQLFVTPWTAARQASPSFTISQNLLRLMSVESVMPSNHLILYRPLLLLSSIFSSIRVFSNELALHIRWPKYWSFSFSIRLSNEYVLVAQLCPNL